MNKAVIAALVGVVGLALGFGAGWVWDELNGGDEPGTPAGTESPATSTSPSPAASS